MPQERKYGQTERERQRRLQQQQLLDEIEIEVIQENNSLKIPIKTADKKLH